jgi:hypothetical protein
VSGEIFSFLTGDIFARASDSRSSRPWVLKRQKVCSPACACGSPLSMPCQALQGAPCLSRRLPKGLLSLKALSPTAAVPLLFSWSLVLQCQRTKVESSPQGMTLPTTPCDLNRDHSSLPFHEMCPLMGSCVPLLSQAGEPFLPFEA